MLLLLGQKSPELYAGRCLWSCYELVSLILTIISVSYCLILLKERSLLLNTMLMGGTMGINFSISSGFMCRIMLWRKSSWLFDILLPPNNQDKLLPGEGGKTVGQIRTVLLSYYYFELPLSLLFLQTRRTTSYIELAFTNQNIVGVLTGRLLLGSLFWCSGLELQISRDRKLYRFCCIWKHFLIGCCPRLVLVDVGEAYKPFLLFLFNCLFWRS